MSRVGKIPGLQPVGRPVFAEPRTPRLPRVLRTAATVHTGPNALRARECASLLGAATTVGWINPSSGNITARRALPRRRLRFHVEDAGRRLRSSITGSDNRSSSPRGIADDELADLRAGASRRSRRTQCAARRHAAARCTPCPGRMRTRTFAAALDAAFEVARRPATIIGVEFAELEQDLPCAGSRRTTR